MEARNRKRLMLFSGSANPPLAQEVADLLGVELGGVDRQQFANGEISIRFTSSSGVNSRVASGKSGKPSLMKP